MDEHALATLSLSLVTAMPKDFQLSVLNGRQLCSGLERARAASSFRREIGFRSPKELFGVSSIPRISFSSLSLFFSLSVRFGSVRFVGPTAFVV